MAVRILFALALLVSVTGHAGNHVGMGNPFRILSDQIEQNEQVLLDISDQLVDTLNDRGSRRWVSPHWKHDNGVRKTIIYVLNIGEKVVNVRVTFFETDGTPHLEKEPKSIPVWHRREFTSSAQDLFASGWVEVFADGPVFVDGGIHTVGPESETQTVTSQRKMSWYRTASPE